MSFYLVHLYYEFGQSLYNPINNINQTNFNGTLYLPLNINQLNNLNLNIIHNNIGIFSKLIMLNTEMINILTYQNLLILVNKDNYILNNNYNLYYLPQYYAILNLELLI